MKNILETILQKRKDYSQAIENVHYLISALCDGVIDSDCSANIPNRNVIFSVDKENRSLTILSKNGDGTQSSEIITIGIDGVDQEFILSSTGESVGQAIFQILRGERLNSVLAHINDVILNYGYISKESALELVNMYDPSAYMEDIQLLRSFIASASDGSITAQQWLVLLYNLEKPIESTLKNDSLELSTTTTTIKTYIGTAIKQIIAGVLQFIGIVLMTISRVLGFIVSIIGTVIGLASDLFNNTQTTFNFNLSACNDIIDTPIKANFKDTPSIFFPVSPDVGGRLLMLPGGNAYFWANKSVSSDENSSACMNFFPSISLHPVRFRHWLRSFLAVHDTSVINYNASLNYFLYEWKIDNFYEDDITMQGTFSDASISASFNDTADYGYYFLQKLCNAIKNGEFNSLLITDEEFSINYSNTTFWYESLIASTAFYSLLNLTGAVNNQLNGQIYNGVSHGKYVATGGKLDLAGSIILMVMSDDEYNTVQGSLSAYGASLPDLYSSIISNQTYQEYPWQSPCFSSMSNYLDYVDAGIVPAVADNRFFNRLNDFLYYMGRDLVVEVSALPSSYFAKWPAYSSDAISNTLKLLGIGLGLGLAIGTGILVTKNVLIPRMKFNISSKLSSLRSDALAHPDDTSRRNKYLSKARMYNVLASAFGWENYDVSDGLFTNSYSANSSVASDNNAELKTILKRIG